MESLFRLYRIDSSISTYHLGDIQRPYKILRTVSAVQAINETPIRIGSGFPVCQDRRFADRNENGLTYDHETPAERNKAVWE